MPKAKKSKHKATKVKLAGTVSKKRTRKPSSSRKAELKYIPWNAVPLEDLNPLFKRQFVVGEDIMVARVLMQKGCIVPLRRRCNRQVTYLLEWALEGRVDGTASWLKS